MVWAAGRVGREYAEERMRSGLGAGRFCTYHGQAWRWFGPYDDVHAWHGDGEYGFCRVWRSLLCGSRERLYGAHVARSAHLPDARLRP